MIRYLFMSVITIFLILKNGGVIVSSPTHDFNILLPNVTTSEEDKYICNSYELIEDKIYITGFKALPDTPYVHHMLLYGCEQLDTTGYRRDCYSACNNEQILFAWAQNANATVLPNGVAFVAGSSTTFKYLVLQVHYLKPAITPDHSGFKIYTTNKSPKFIAGVMLFVGTSMLPIPPGEKQYQINVSCKIENDIKIHPFAFRVHSHNNGKIISAYTYSNNIWKQIGKSNPQWPHFFWPMTHNMTITKGDYLLSKCVYDSTHNKENVFIGATHHDEMCNFYMMYYKEVESEIPLSICAGDAYPEIVSNYPLDGLIPLPINIKLEVMAHSNHMGGDKKMHEHMNSNFLPVSIKMYNNWINFENGFTLGMVSSVFIHDKANLYVLQRGNASWNQDSFDINDNYNHKKDPPIKEATILKIDLISGIIVNSWGFNYFYMPHGLFVDSRENLWITDVALHQIFMFTVDSLKNNEKSIRPSLILGIRFEPGKDFMHFCKPSDINVTPKGDFFVSDGYCNSRVLHFNKDGILIYQWEIEKKSNSFILPHSLTIDETNNVLYVVDRLNYRILSYNISSSTEVKHIKTIDNLLFKPELFAITYCSFKNVIFAVNGDLTTGYEKSTYVFLINPLNSEVLFKWKPSSNLTFNSPHDIAASSDCKFVFVADKNKIWKFEVFYEPSDNNSIIHVDHTNYNSKKGSVFSHRHPKVLEEKNGFFSAIGMLKAGIIITCLILIPPVAVIALMCYLKCKKKSRSRSNLEEAQKNNRRMVGNVNRSGYGKLENQDNLKNPDELKRLESDSEAEEFDAMKYHSNRM